MTDPSDLPPFDDDIQGLLDAERAEGDGTPGGAKDRVWSRVSATLGLPAVPGLDMDPTGGLSPGDGGSLLPVDPAGAVGAAAKGAGAAKGAATVAVGNAAGTAAGAGAVGAGGGALLTAKTAIIGVAAAGGIAGTSYVALKEKPVEKPRAPVVQVVEKTDAPPPPVPFTLPEKEAKPEPEAAKAVEKTKPVRPSQTESPAKAHKKASPPPTLPSTLKEERKLLEAARSALRANQSASAERSLNRHKKQFPKGRLVEEREALLVLAAFQGTDLKQAQEAAELFFKRFPKSLFRSAIESARDQRHPR
jgi:hypothetical protein